VTSNEFRERLSARAENAGVPIAADVAAKLETYFQLLTRWNAKINLTALPLRRPTHETFDRLLIEPLAAARFVADSARRWFDIGSGGGSPAIPLKIVHPRAELTMVESRARKAAFLREAVRALGLSNVEIENLRFEDLAGRVRPHTIDLVSMRAVRNAPPLLIAIHRVVSPNGRVFLFQSPAKESEAPVGFVTVEVARLGTGRDARLGILKPVFHVEQRGIT
jgi:16S rRNA (guanine527-N7)-methyltransferase